MLGLINTFPFEHYIISLLNHGGKKKFNITWEILPFGLIIIVFVFLVMRYHKTLIEPSNNFITLSPEWPIKTLLVMVLVVMMLHLVWDKWHLWHLWGIDSSSSSSFHLVACMELKSLLMVFNPFGHTWCCAICLLGPRSLIGSHFRSASYPRLLGGTQIPWDFIYPRHDVPYCLLL